ncbi:30S ribosomal protein S1, chloroplastic [Ananas comosus]|uniref:30S ribosomal protein S1, chloroplastic n=1 Tax=Ananas comosus TaxID=4615 RepID=A0A199V0U9_ANACO|nr:30S ribosomal protein S1, chloroplastic [Ananas comosus]
MFSTVGAIGGFSLLSKPYSLCSSNSNSNSNDPSSPTPIAAASSSPSLLFLNPRRRRRRHGHGRRSSFFFPLACAAELASSGSGLDQKKEDEARLDRRAADWRAARTYKESGVIFEGKVEGSNNGGLLLRFYSLLGFLPYPLLSPSHSCRDPLRTIQETAKDLVGSSIAVKVLEANEEEKKLIFSEKDASWSKYSSQVKIGDVFDAVVGSVEDYGAFAHLRFPDGRYHLTGLVHVSEVSWDLVQDVRDFLNEGDQVKVKVINIDREKSRITLSIKQLEDDPLLETLEKLGRQGLEKRVVSQDLELWLSNVPAKDKQFTLLARAGRQVQEVYLTTTLNQDGIKKAVQRVLGRVP